jgi:hypothetical protein
MGYFFHKLSTDDNPQHCLYPSYCNNCYKFKKITSAGAVYQHGLPLLDDVIDKFKSVFRDLTNVDLLKRYLCGKTQYPNESLKSVILSH